MKNKLYSTILPAWFLLVFPLTWFIAIPVNFIINTVALIAAFKLFKVNNAYETYKRVILKVCMVGLIANLITMGFLLIADIIPGNKGVSLYSAVTEKFMWNPYENLITTLTVITAILISIFVLYRLNFRISFRKAHFERKTAKYLSMFMAVITAPWLILFPFNVVYNEAETMSLFEADVMNKMQSNHVKNILNELEGSSYIDAGVFDSKDLKVSVNCGINISDPSKVEQYKQLFESDQTNEILSKNAVKIFEQAKYIDDVVFNVNASKTYFFNRNEIIK